MPVFGLRTDKSFGTEKFANRYYVKAVDKTTAIAYGYDIVSAEKQVFGAAVAFDNIHVWTVGVSPNDYLNQPLSYVGDLSVVAPTSPVVCAGLTMVSDSSYPLSKSYRVCLDAGAQFGFTWQASVLTALDNVANDLAALAAAGKLCTKSGGDITSIVRVNNVEYRQLGKQWYNRTP